MTLQRWAVRLALGRCRFDEIGLVAGVLHRFSPTFDQDGDTFAIEVHLEALTAHSARGTIQHQLDLVPITLPTIESMIAVRAPRITPTDHTDDTTPEPRPTPPQQRIHPTPTMAPAQRQPVEPRSVTSSDIDSLAT